MKDSCILVRRGDFYDVYLNGKKCGSGTWNYVDMAVYFYRLEGFSVKVSDK